VVDFGIDPYLYNPIFHSVIFALCFFVAVRYTSSKNNDNLLKQQPVAMAVVLCVILILIIGLRPVSWAFGDTGNYARSYDYLLTTDAIKIDFRKEWLFGAYTWFCKSSGMHVQLYFLGIELGYIGFHMWACKKLLWESPWIAFLFCLSAFSFFTYGVNGLRNGLACAMIIMAIAFVAESKNYIGSFVLAFCAMGIHRSTALPIVACLASLTVVKNSRIALMIWLAAIPLSLVAGDSFTSFFANLGFDDRMDAYSVIDLKESFSSMGFRWDFLFYSSMPALLVWFVNKRIDNTGGIRKDGSSALADATSVRVFNILATTYLLSNSFWILVNRANFSNRFAYLSWFLYPIVLAYGFIRLRIWDNQDRKCAWALLAHAGFTMVMLLMGK